MMSYEGMSHFFQLIFLYLHLVQLGHPHPLPVDVDVEHTEDEAGGVCVDVLHVEHIVDAVAHCDLKDETSLLNSPISL